MGVFTKNVKYAHDLVMDDKMRNRFLSPIIQSRKLISNLSNSRDFFSRYPIDFDERYSRISYIADPLEWLSYIDTLKLRPRERLEITKFYFNLHFYKILSSRCGFEIEIPVEELWYESLSKGPSYANLLDDVWAYSLRQRIGLNYIVPQDMVGKTRQIKSYSSIFPPRLLPLFREDTNDMVEYTQARPSGYSEALAAEIESLIRSTKFIDLVDDEEIIATPRNSASWDSVKGTKPRNNKFLCTDFEQQKMIGRRVKVTVYPSGCRDTIVLDKRCANSVRWIERVLNTILTSIPEAYGGCNIEHKRHMYTTLCQRSKIHLLRDIKKCGLTIPIGQYVDVFRETLNSCYPDPRWDRLNIFKEIHILDEETNTWIDFKRGVGLGMANALTTLLLIAFHRLVLSETGYTSKDIWASIGNDDADIAVVGNYNLDESLDIIEDYETAMFDLSLECGIELNMKKTFKSQYGLFFEEYTHPDFLHKWSLLAGQFSNAVIAPDIRIAKLICRNIQLYEPSPIVRDIILEEVAPLFPYEFSIIDNEFPFHLGGWFIDEFMGFEVTKSYITRENCGYLYRVWSFIRYQLNPRVAYGEIESPEDNSLRLARILQYTGPALLDDDGIPITYSISDSILNHSDEKSEERFVDRIKKIRKSFFTRKVSETYENFIHILNMDEATFPEGDADVFDKAMCLLNAEDFSDFGNSAKFLVKIGAIPPFRKQDERLPSCTCEYDPRGEKAAAYYLRTGKYLWTFPGTCTSYEWIDVVYDCPLDREFRPLYASNGVRSLLRMAHNRIENVSTIIKLLNPIRDKEEEEEEEDRHEVRDENFIPYTEAEIRDLLSLSQLENNSGEKEEFLPIEEIAIESEIKSQIASELPSIEAIAEMSIDEFKAILDRRPLEDQPKFDEIDGVSIPKDLVEDYDNLIEDYEKTYHSFIVGAIMRDIMGLTYHKNCAVCERLKQFSTIKSRCTVDHPDPSFLILSGKLDDLASQLELKVDADLGNAGLDDMFGDF